MQRVDGFITCNYKTMLEILQLGMLQWQKNRVQVTFKNRASDEIIKVTNEV
jgi:hypothetical protein